MAERELSSTARAFLREKRFAVLATVNRNGTPQQSVVWYDLDGDEILMNTKAGRIKERNLRRDPRCSICIDDGYRYLTIRGTVTLIDDQAVAQEDIRRLSTRYHGPERAEQQMRDQFSNEHRVTLRLTVERVKEYGF
ncbi:MAG TPA: PPOX class F420-dependent oxidoreductase [Chloroflexota bacterium]|nr:PPOX class F420-dependent oxidoreductase [Chloroflexota bacterium]